MKKHEITDAELATLRSFFSLFHASDLTPEHLRELAKVGLDVVEAVSLRTVEEKPERKPEPAPRFTHSLKRRAEDPTEYVFHLFEDGKPRVGKFKILVKLRVSRGRKTFAEALEISEYAYGVRIAGPEIEVTAAGHIKGTHLGYTPKIELTRECYEDGAFRLNVPADIADRTVAVVDFPELMEERAR